MVWEYVGIFKSCYAKASSLGTSNAKAFILAEDYSLGSTKKVEYSRSIHIKIASDTICFCQYQIQMGSMTFNGASTLNQPTSN